MLDDIIKEFEEKSKNATSKYRKYYDGKDLDNLYEVDIHIWRKPGMGNSLQTISGNKVSIMTGVASLLNTLLIKEVCSKEELVNLLNMVIKGGK